MRYFTYRQGDRAEYLAQYILSALAITIPVPRQEDVGVDFHCSLLRREGKKLYPSSPFNIQIKSAGKGILRDGVRFGGVTKKGMWRDYQIKQLCNTDTPFLVGLIDLKKQRLDLFCTITRYFVLSNWRGIQMPREVALLPYVPNSDGNIGDGWHEDLPQRKGMPGTLWKLPLGQPIVSMTIADSEKPQRCEEVKTILEAYIRMDQENAIRFRSGLGYFNWPLKIQPGKQIDEWGVGIATPTHDGPETRQQLRTVKCIAASLLSAYEAAGKKSEILAWESILPQLPEEKLTQLAADLIDKAMNFARNPS